MSHFNYIITIHNRELMIRDVLWGILLGAGPGAHIYAVLDGCTDRTEAIIDKLCDYYAHVPLTKVIAPDVHETLSINAGLEAAQRNGRQLGHGFNVILQDDVILADRHFESKILHLYEKLGPKLGYVSLRMGCQFAPNVLEEGDRLQIYNLIESAYGVGMTTEVLWPGEFAYRCLPLKSPVVLPCSVVRDVGIMRPEFAPHSYDDADLACGAIAAGYFNGVYGIQWYSDMRWGRSRQNTEASIDAAHRKNAPLVRQFNPEILKTLSRPQRTETVQIIPCTEAERAHAARMLELSRAAVEVAIG